jgi:hypothetical protein
MISMLCVCVPPLLTSECLKLGEYIMAPDPVSAAYFVNLSISLCVCIYISYIVARQR